MQETCALRSVQTMQVVFGNYSNYVRLERSLDAYSDLYNCRYNFMKGREYMGDLLYLQMFNACHRKKQIL